MTQFEKILNHYKNTIYGWCDLLKYDKDVITSYKVHLRSTDKSQFSINDLLSPNSWLIQAVKWKDWNWEIAEWEVFGMYSEYYRNNNWQYHSMMLSILPDKEKIKYIEENVIID